jgi:nicotinic acetylcholine receptor
MWLKFEWEDVNLKWEPLEYANISDLRYPFDRIWRPGNSHFSVRKPTFVDVLLYNSVDSAFDTTFKVNVVGLSNGQITWVSM